MFEQQTIATDIRDYCRNLFREESLNFTQEEIEEAITIFFNAARLDTPYPRLNGFQREIEDALTRCCISEQGKTTPLKELATLLDAFMKRCLYFIGRTNYATIGSTTGYGDMTAYHLINELGVFTSFQGYSNDNTRESWRKDLTGRFIVANALVPRNITVHNSTDWDKAKVFESLKYVIGTYIFIILKLHNDLLTHTPAVLASVESKKVLDERDLQAYDFLNYSRVSRVLKNQIIESFILRTLYKESHLNLEAITQRVNDFISTESIEIVRPRLNKLIKDNRVKILPTTEYTLTEEETTRLSQSEADCALNKHNFLVELAHILNETENSTFTIEVYESFTKFLRDRYRQTTKTTIDSNEEPTPDNSFLMWLTNRVNSAEKAKDIYKAIVHLCATNDIVYRLCIGAVISSLTDSKDDIFAIQKLHRNIYLDTQIVLAILGISFAEFGAADLTITRQAESILRIGEADNISLLFCETYLPEVYTHIHRAIGLSFWEDNPAFNSGIFSQNVFYQHYIALKRTATLPHDIYSFSEYLSILFYMGEKDFNEGLTRYLRHTLPTIIEKRLKDAGVEIQIVPRYESHELRESESIFEEVIRKSASTKFGNTLKRDAIVGKYLFSCNISPRPFFITLDSTFSKYRDLYADTYFRTEGYFWQLFSPMKFLNTHHMIGMQVNKDLLSEDLLLLIEDGQTKTNAKLFMDVNQILTDIDGLSERQKQERQQMNFRIFSGKEFGDLSEGDMDLINDIATDINRTWDEIASYFNDSKNSGTAFYEALLEDDIYEKVMEEISRFLQEIKDKNHRKLFEKVSDIIENNHLQ